MAIHCPSQVSDPHPEWELVLRCARVGDDKKNIERIDELLHGKLDWAVVLDYTTRHRIAPFVYERLMATRAAAVPMVQQGVLRETASAAARSSLVLLQEMIRLHDLFETEQLPLMPYKGPILAWLAYQNFTRREFTDLDFVLPQRHIPRATALLRAAGYNETFDLREAHDGQDGFAPGQYLFVSKAHAIQVELHTERTLRYFPVQLDLDDMRRRLIAVEIAGRALHTFSVEETLVMLCVHGAKHFWERLSWIVDIAAIVSTQTLDWERALQAAEKMQSRRLLLLGLELAHEMLAAPLPQSIVDMAKSDSQTMWLVHAVCSQYEGTRDIGANVISRTAFRLRSRDGLIKGLSHLVRLTTVPTESDRQMVRLPHALAPLYIVLRPWRLLREYGIGLRRRM